MKLVKKMADDRQRWGKRNVEHLKRKMNPRSVLDQKRNEANLNAPVRTIRNIKKISQNVVNYFYQKNESKARKKNILPPNCEHQDSYESFRVCKPDHICGKDKNIKNPGAYPIRKMENTEKYKKLTEKSKKTRKRSPQEPPAASGLY